MIERIDGDLDRCLQVAFILDSLDSEAETAQDTLFTFPVRTFKIPLLDFCSSLSKKIA